MLRSRFGSSRLSCCIVQLEPVHEEITPSFVLALNELGFHVDVYLPKKSLINKGDVYEFISGLNVSVYYWKPEKRAKTWNALRQSIVGSGYSFCVFSTFQFPGCIAFAKHLNIPIFGVVHKCVRLVWFLCRCIIETTITAMLRGDTTTLVLRSIYCLSLITI